MATSTIQITALAICISPTAALFVDHKFQASADVIGQTYTITAGTLLFEIFLNGALIYFTYDVYGF